MPLVRLGRQAEYLSNRTGSARPSPSTGEVPVLTLSANFHRYDKTLRLPRSCGETTASGAKLMRSRSNTIGFSRT